MSSVIEVRRERGNFFEERPRVEGMDPEPLRSTRLALGLLTVVLALTTAWRRSAEEGFFAPEAPSPPPGEGICVGFALGDEDLGVACGGSTEAAVSAAVDRLGLPVGCGGASLPGDIGNGERLVFGEGEAGWEIVSRGRLDGPTRLLVGAGLDVNRDAEEDLTALPGIGEAKARRIVESRERDGPFRTLEDLTRVEGIGARTVERLAPWLEW
jgi:competence protein ComEA